LPFNARRAVDLLLFVAWGHKHAAVAPVRRYNLYSFSPEGGTSQPTKE
jgi:hypothetical protein